MTDNYKYVFGPVPSRRLGYSLGVDIIPFKTCTQNCLYCQLVKDAPTTTQIKPYVPIEPVFEEIKRKLDSGVHADYITISGSGEPTLNSRIGQLIDMIKQITDIPVSVITNGTLLWNPQVRENLKNADLVMHSLDAGDEEVFRKINKPDPSITFDMLISGLIEFRREFKGQIWLEIFMIDGYNTDDIQLARIHDLVAKINPDRVQLNTAVRPTAAAGVSLVEPMKLHAIAKKIGHNAEVIADFSKAGIEENIDDLERAILDTLKRRPCSIDDLTAGLGANRNEISKYISILLDAGKINSQTRDTGTYYTIND